MKGKSLADYQMLDTRHVRAGQTVSVGLRSTDLVEKLFTKALHGLNSVEAKGISTLFVAQNFNSTVLPTAVRLLVGTTTSLCITTVLETLHTRLKFST